MPRSFRSITILIALATFAVGITAHAIAKDETLQDWIDMWKQDRVQIENYVRAEQDGMLWSNVYSTSHQRPLLYCQPERLSLTGRQMMDMLRRAAEETPELLKAPLGFAVLATLRRTFPCP
jgi:hypothetical protein